MMRGMTYFKCPKCSNVFKGPDIEDRATVRTMLQPCPDCGAPSPKYEGIAGWLMKLLERK